MNGICGREIEFVPGKFHAHTHTRENWVCNTVHAPVAGASSTFGHRRLLAADFDILSHYVDNLDVCLAHSRRIQFGENATSENLHIFCSRRKTKKEKRPTFLRLRVRGSFVRDLNVASFSIYQIKIVPQNCHWGREKGISWGWFQPSLNPIPIPPWDCNVTVAGSASPTDIFIVVLFFPILFYIMCLEWVCLCVCACLCLPVVVCVPSKRRKHVRAKHFSSF